MEYKVNTDYGTITIKDVVIDLKGKNVKGVDCARGIEFLFNMPGHTAMHVRKDKALLHKWLHKHTYPDNK